ncbi:MAG: hypothetical protein VW268_00310 [Rhodospirillaceae bacterium]
MSETKTAAVLLPRAPPPPISVTATLATRRRVPVSAAATLLTASPFTAGRTATCLIDFGASAVRLFMILSVTA